MPRRGTAGCIKLTENWNSVSVSRINPTWRWDGDHVMTEVNKSVHQMPVVESIGIILSRTLDESTIKNYWEII